MHRTELKSIVIDSSDEEKNINLRARRTDKFKILNKLPEDFFVSILENLTQSDRRALIAVSKDLFRMVDFHEAHVVLRGMEQNLRALLRYFSNKNKLNKFVFLESFENNALLSEIEDKSLEHKLLIIADENKSHVELVDQFTEISRSTLEQEQKLIAVGVPVTLLNACENERLEQELQLLKKLKETRLETYLKTEFKLSETQRDSLNEFIDLTTVEIRKSNRCIGQGWNGWENLLLFAAIFSVPALVFFSTLIGPAGDAWEAQRRRMVTIDAGGFGLSCATAFVDTTYGLCPLGMRALYRSEVPEVCYNACDTLNRLGGRWGGDLTGILVPALVLLGMMIWLYKKGFADLSRDFTRFYTLPINELPKKIKASTRDMLAEFRATGFFSATDMRTTTYGNVLQKAIRMRARFFQESASQDSLLDVNLDTTRNPSQSDRRSMSQPLLQEFKRAGRSYGTGLD